MAVNKPDGGPSAQKHILLNPFDMSTIEHLSPGQWKRPGDLSTTKRRLDYRINLAKLLEKGDINALFLADTYGGYDTYQNSLDDCIRRAAQWSMTDPTVPFSAMAAVTKNLAFGITASTSFEPHFWWNIVTSWKKSAFKAIGIVSPIEHDERYLRADEYMRVLYKLWEGSWSDDAIIADAVNDAYFDPDRIRTIKHHGNYYDLESPHTTDPSPQRTPFLFQAGTSEAGSSFASRHAEATFASSHRPTVLRPKVDKIRALAAKEGRDPRSIKVFGTFTPIIGQTDEEAKQKYQEHLKAASTIGGLVLFSGWTAIDISKIPLDKDITAEGSEEANKITSIMSAFTTTSEEMPRWTPRVVAEKASIGGLGPVGVGSPQTVAGEMERWVKDGDIDGFNIAYVTTPDTFEEVVELLIPELRRRGLYPQKIEEGLTARGKVYGKGQAWLRADHSGSAYKYDIYQEEPPYLGKEKETLGKRIEETKASATTGAARIELTKSSGSPTEDGPSHGRTHTTGLPRHLFKQWLKP